MSKESVFFTGHSV